MVRAAALILALAFSVAAQAQPKSSGLSSFVTLADNSYETCLTLYSQRLQRNEMSGYGGVNCTYREKRLIEPMYAATKAALSKQPGKLSLLNDYYALWTAGMDGLEPVGGETRITYASRIASEYQQLQRVSARLKLED